MREYRVLYLVPDLFGPPGGIARHARTLCQALLQGHVDLTTIALLDDPDALSNALESLCHMSYHACSGDRRKFAMKTVRVAREIKPHIVLVEHPNFSPLGLFTARLLRVPCVVIAHGVDAWNLLPPVRRAAFKTVDRVLCVSQFTARRAIEINGLAKERTHVLYNCLDPILQDSLPDTTQINRQMKQQKPSMLTVSRVLCEEDRKGHFAVVRAMPKLLEKFPNLIYDVVGDGKGRSDLEKLAHVLGVTHAVRFHGNVSDEQIKQFYENATFFIMPSQREGFGLVFIEAMQFGMPAVGGNKDATTEVIDDGQTGFTVDPDSIEEIVDAASKLLSDTALCYRMGERAQRAVEERFSFDVFQKSLFTHLDELIVL